jgi:hypothetical protein
MGEGWLAGWLGFREKTVEGWGRFNEELKVWCEKGDVESVAV